MVERKSKGPRPFSLEELTAWWESEGTLALLPKGCAPDKTCLKAQFAITQIAPMMFHKGIRDALVEHCGIDERACFVYKDRVIMRNPREIRKVIDTFKPLVRLPRRQAQIEAFTAFYKNRKDVLRPYIPKPTLRKKWK